MKSFRTIKKNAKALSPVVASIILIAVTVAVSVVVAAWMGGMSIGMMGNAEQGSVTNVYFASTTPQTIAVTISNSGASNMNFTAAYVNGQAVATVAPLLNSAGGGVGKSATASYTLTANWVSGTTYDIKFTTTKGNNVETTVTAP
jgi:archaeal type IV pilus assembly protein PilA